MAQKRVRSPFADGANRTNCPVAEVGQSKPAGVGSLIDETHAECPVCMEYFDDQIYQCSEGCITTLPTGRLIRSQVTWFAPLVETSCQKISVHHAVRLLDPSAIVPWSS